MAKINVSNIEGYDAMTAEEKLAALEAFEYEDNLSELEKYKNAASKANSEAAEWRKRHNALLSEEERKKQERDDELSELRNKLETMEAEKRIAGHKAEFLALGYDEPLADDSAKALADGDTAKVFANQKKFLEAHDHTLKAEFMKKTPTPPAGSPDAPMTIERFRGLSPAERYEFSVNNPEEYKKLYGGNE